MCSGGGSLAVPGRRWQLACGLGCIGRSQQFEDRQALAHQAGEQLVDSLRTVQHGQVGICEAAGRCLDQRGQLLDETAGRDQLLVALAERRGPGFVSFRFTCAVARSA